MTTEVSNIVPPDAIQDSTLHDHEILFDKIKTELSKFGLTPNQSKVFIHLEKYGSSTATQISKTLKVPRTETYHLLTNLQNKGIVSATFQHPIKFTALPLDKAIGALINAEKERVKNLENQEKSLVELWSALPSFKVNKEEIKDGRFQMLQGINQMTGKIKEMVTSAKNSIQILASEKDFMKFYHAGYLELIRDSKAEVQLVSSSSDKTAYIFEGKLIDKVKRIPLKVKEDLCFIIKDDEQAILFMKNMSETPQNVLAMWTDSYSMVYTLKLLFTYIWSNSKHLRVGNDD
ncbi:MAG: TrmB family transcriptional regulator [Nitrosotalea sp.]